MSWARLRPRPEIILIGDELGTSEMTRQVRGQYYPMVARNEFGTPMMDDIFGIADEIATYDCLCYVNADIILPENFVDVALEVEQRFAEVGYLMIGSRIDVDIDYEIDFSDPSWDKDLSGKIHSPAGIDYHVFHRGLYTREIVPPFVIGRTSYDNWMVWYALKTVPHVMDASRVVRALHQNHGNPRGLIREAKSNGTPFFMEIAYNRAFLVREQVKHIGHCTTILKREENYG